jgi:excisionase family DNA binding protein
MNKTEAAQFLKVSPRTLQRLSQQGKINVAYKNSKSGAAADYDEADLQRYLEQQQNSIIYRPATEETQALATTPNTNIITGADRLAAALEALHHPPKKPTVPIEEKLLLKLDEAAALTGLSRQTLRTAIDTKKLRAQIAGRAWRIKRVDLESFVKNF